MLYPITDLPGLFRQLKAKGVQIAIATADNRQSTLATLKHLNCDPGSIFLACADDNHLPAKPDPALLRLIAKNWNASTDKVIMIGDTIGDVHMAQKAGDISIGVLTGAATSQMLAPYTNLVFRSIDQLEISI